MSADFFARAYSTFIAYLAEPAARSLMIGCVAAAALAAFRVKRVGTRLLVWTAVLCAALAMPFLDALLPRVQFAVPASPLAKILQAKINPARAVIAQSETNPAASPDVAASPRASHALIASAGGSKLALPMRGNEREIARRATRRADAIPIGKLAALPAPVRADAPRVASPAAAIPWAALLLIIYLLGVAILLARLLIGIWFSRRLERAAQKIDATDTHSREALRLLRFRSCIAGLANTPLLKESALLAVPATLGIRRPVILLPADWRSWPRPWSEEQLDAVLAHEISHVARRDALTQLLSLIHRAIFWFNPLAWWLDMQFTDLAEQASDEAALAAGADRARYAETLLAFFAQLAASRRRVWWQGLAMAKHHKANGIAERRVTRILAWKGAMSMKKSVAVAVIALAVPLIFLAASVHPFIAYAQEAPRPPAPPQNIILPGGPVAPALPNPPKGGINGGVVAPALPNAPKAGVVAPPALSGSEIRIQRTPPAIAAPVPYAPYASVAPTAPPTLQAAIAAEDSARAQDATAQLQAAEQAIQNAEHVSQAARGEQLRAALKAVAQAEQESDEANSAQMLAAQHALEKANRIMEQGYVSKMTEVKEAMAEARRDLQEAQAAQKEAARNITITGGSYTMYNGPRYVIMSGPNEGVEMSGDDEDFRHAQELRKKLGKDLIWFERDEKSYVITDPDFIAKAKALFAPEDALSKQQDELSRQQDALSKQQDALSEKQDSVKVKVPDISPDLQRIKSELDSLRNQDGATQRELGRLQSELGQLQSQVGRFQSDAGVQQSDIGRQQGELGRQQGELGRKQGELGRQQGQLARKASAQLRQMLDDAIAKGIAKSE